MERRMFLKVGAGAVGSMVAGCRCGRDGCCGTKAVKDCEMQKNDQPFEISLAQWSLHKRLFDQGSGKLDNLDFAMTAKQLGIEAIEYVNIFFKDKADDSAYLTPLNQQAHQRISMMGGAFNKVKNSFLFKTEAAFFSNLRLSSFRQNGILIENTNEYQRLDLLAGLEYSGFRNTNLSIEVADKWIINYNNLARQMAVQICNGIRGIVYRP